MKKERDTIKQKQEAQEEEGLIGKKREEGEAERKRVNRNARIIYRRRVK